MRVAFLVACLTLAACKGDDTSTAEDTDISTDTGTAIDADGDGFTADEDCDDDPSGCGADCYPGNTATDSCDGNDVDCDGTVGEDEGDSFYADCDGDGSHGPAIIACAEPTTTACDDGAAPDGGFATATPTEVDCDDEDAAQNHDDADGDGYSTCEGDCDDDTSACGSFCFPGNTASDTCDTYDADCDNTIGEDDERLWYPDCDGDGDLSATGMASCDEPTTSPCAGGAAPLGSWSTREPIFPDCDDTDASANFADADQDGISTCGGDCDDDPNACGAACSPALTVDGCDTYNNDCDGETDEDPDVNWYLDADQDQSTVGTPTLSCTSPGNTYTAGASATVDCDDGDASLNTRDDDGDGETTCAGDCDDDPNACGDQCKSTNTVDGCDSYDNDCDVAIDENPGSTIWYLDADDDSWVASTTGIGQCDSPGADYTTRLSSEIDCDDSDATQNHDDADGDGYATCDGDCDDDASACGDACSPGITTDICDSYNNDCDGQTDENPPTWYEDGDQDGATLASSAACAAPGANWQSTASSAADCNDADAALNQKDEDGDSVSTCDGDCDDDPLACGDACSPNISTDGCDVNSYDNDCDNQTDEDPETTWYLDEDGDSWSADLTGTQACTAPTAKYSRTASNQADCDDSDSAQNYDDADGDSYATCEGDCDDDVNACGTACAPNLTTDACDDYNNDCDGQTDENPDVEWFADADSDGWTAATATLACDSPGSTYTQTETNPVDCDDDDASLNHSDADGDGDTSCEGDCADQASDLSQAAIDAGLSASDINASATEIWYDGVDQNCAGDNDFDQDGDGFVADGYATETGGTANRAEDCDDNPTDDVAGWPASGTNYLADELCDNIDNDCDDRIDELDNSQPGYVSFLPTAGGVETVVGAYSVDEPGVVWVCGETYAAIAVASDDVSVLGRTTSTTLRPSSSTAPAVSWNGGYTGGVLGIVDLVTTGGALALDINEGAEVVTTQPFSLRGTATIDGTWTANNMLFSGYMSTSLRTTQWVTVGPTGTLTARDWEYDNGGQPSGRHYAPAVTIEGDASFYNLYIAASIVRGETNGTIFHGTAGSTLYLESPVVTSIQNGAGRKGGLLYSDGDVTIDYGDIKNNSAALGGSIYIGGPGSLTMTNTWMSYDNAGEDNAVAIIESEGLLDIADSTVKATGSTNVAIRTSGDATLTNVSLADTWKIGLNLSGNAVATMSNVDFSRIPINGTCPEFDEVSLVLNDGTPIQLSPQASASVTAVCGSTCTPALIDVCN